jgi:hypothetical protein
MATKDAMSHSILKGRKRKPTELVETADDSVLTNLQST